MSKSIKKYTNKERLFLYMVFEEARFTTWNCAASKEELKFFRKFYPEAITSQLIGKTKYTVVNYGKLNPRKYTEIYIGFLEEEYRIWFDKYSTLKQKLEELSQDE